MRLNHLIPAVLFLSLAGCQLQDLEPSELDLGVAQQASIGGQLAEGKAHYAAVAAITVLLPLSNPNTDPTTVPRTDYRYCTGVLVEARTVLTAARCLDRNFEFELDEDRPEEYLDPISVVVQFGSSASAGTEYYLDATFSEGPKTVKGLTMHRYFEIGASGVNDVALLRLSEAPGITPALINDEPLGADLVGTPLELVGYGKSQGDAEKLEFTRRKVVTPEIVSISDARVKAGTAEKTTCYADQGGPGFLEFDAVAKVATISSLHNPTSCVANPDPTRQRVDVYAADFILPFIKFHSGGCDGETCDNCEYNLVCEEDCPTRDWDCPVDHGMPGEACIKDGDCEMGGRCVPAGDDPSFNYCSTPCDAASANPCMGSLTCEAGECIYVGISPGSQGAVCSTPDNCRSGYCENSLCAYPCDAADPDACDAANGFFCTPAESDGTTVCRQDSRSGGGGFCVISKAGSRHGGQGSGFLMGLAVIFLAGVFLRRRQA